MKEVWKDIPSCPSYKASSLGRIEGPKALLRQQMIAQYLHVGIDGKMVKVSRLVCEAFHGSPFEGAMALHKNGNQFNNEEHNLYWGTHAQNIEDRNHHGRTSKEHAAMLDWTKVREIRNRNKEGVSQYKLATEYGVSGACISHIIANHTWKEDHA